MVLENRSSYIPNKNAVYKETVIEGESKKSIFYLQVGQESITIFEHDKAIGIIQRTDEMMPLRSWINNYDNEDDEFIACDLVIQDTHLNLRMFRIEAENSENQVREIWIHENHD
jgi:hypothetical protein